MTDCSSIQGSTSSSSDVISSRGGVVTPRIRVIRMIRPNSRRVLLGPENNIAFGFAIRGGKEFGTGFFVSRVEKGSEADIKGLRIGDQIVRVNGYHVDDAVHKELTQFISSQDRLTLKVRGVGMLPIKEKTVDPLTWHIVPRHVLTSLSGLDDITYKDVRIVLKVAPRTKLGLGICKGPEWKPGIFVQFTKEFSVARDAGLRPGDQILSCNSIDFSDVLFSEAVAVMKSSQTLEMIVRTGAGLDLFPGESSGYNSSASSVTGDQSPCWGDHTAKRLSMVREETQNWTERNNLDRRKETPTNPENHSSPEIDSNKTIIQLSENGTLINNTLISNTNTNIHLQSGSENLTIRQNCDSSSSGDGNVKLNFITPDQSTGAEIGGKANGKIADICFVSRQSETKTVIVEVHRSASEENRSATGGSTTTAASTTAAPAPPPKPPSSDMQERCPSVASTTSSCGTTSLSSAITEELKKRQERRCVSQDANPINLVDHQQSRQQPKRLINSPDNNRSNEDERRRRHNSLMDEFKRAHRRMFKNGFQEDDKQERQEELNKATVMRDEVDRPLENGHGKTENITNFPTPPPPPQFANEPVNNQNFNNELKPSQLQQRTVPPQSPIPDYDSTPSHTLPKCTNTYSNGSIKGTIGRVVASQMAKANGDIAELESIESYKLQNPLSTIPKPPSVYFNPQNSGPPTMKKTTRPVSVTIGEYGGNNFRKEPSKLDFIKANIENGNQQQNQIPKDDNVSEMLRSELEKTLSRSNLKKRNEILQSNGQLNISNGKQILQKTQSSNIEKIANMLQAKHNQSELNNNRSATLVNTNKVTINLPNKIELRKTESSPTTTATANATATNGILKNGYTKSNFTEKSITFGN